MQLWFVQGLCRLFALLALLIGLNLPAACSAENLRVYFATTRLNEGSERSPLYLGSRHLDRGAGTTDYGSCFLERPHGLVSLEKAGNGQAYKRIVRGIGQAWDKSRISSPEKCDETVFFSAIRNWNGPICLYIHGYDISFDDALRDIAKLTNEYNNRQDSQANKILPVLFTWPSLDSPAHYAADEANLEWSERSFHRFLNRMLAEKSPASALDIVAHSMGNRLVFWYCAKEAKPDKPPTIRRLFLASADLDYHASEECKDDIQNAVSQMAYIFVSDKDGPLLLSEYLHKQPRLGRPIDPPLIKPDRIDGALTANSFLQLTMDTAGIWLKNALNDPPEVTKWLSINPAIDQDFGSKAKLIDVTDIINDEMGHGLPWSIIAGLMQDPPSLKPFSYFVTHKRPDRAILEQNNGMPPILYKFNKIDIDKFGLSH